MPKTYVVKNNKERYNKWKMMGAIHPDVTYEKYNTLLVLREFIGCSLYRLVGNSPKVYISVDDTENYQLNSKQVIEGRPQTLADYLEIMLSQEICNLDPMDIAGMREKVQKLTGMGTLCYMAMLLGDNDVFGRKLDNVLVQNQVVIKIDASEIKLLGNEEEAYNASLTYFMQSMQTQSTFIDHRNMPYFDFIYGLLSEEQKQEGLIAINSLSGEEFEKAIAWIIETLKFDKKVTESMLTSLKLRRDAMLKHFDPKHVISETIKLNDIKQSVVFRSPTNFEPTGAMIFGGNSKPAVHSKTASAKKVDNKYVSVAKDALGGVIAELEKIRSASLTKKNDKRVGETAHLNEAIEKLDALYLTIEKSNPKDSKAIPAIIYYEFNEIMSNLHAALLNDPSELGRGNEIRRTTSDLLQFFQSTLGKEVKLSTTETVKKIQGDFNKRYNAYLNDRENELFPPGESAKKKPTP